MSSNVATTLKGVYVIKKKGSDFFPPEMAPLLSLGFVLYYSSVPFK